MKTYFLFSAWPYMALALLLVGVIVRYLLTRTQLDALRAELMDARTVFGGNPAWYLSLLLLALGHMMVLLFPGFILSWNSSPVRLYLLEFSGFILGLVALGSFGMLLWRHTGRSNRSVLIEISDVVFLSLLFLGIASGLYLAVAYRWASSWGALILTPYIASLLRFNPTTQFAAEMPFVVRLHLFTTFAALAVLPLTRLGAFLVQGLQFFFERLARITEAMGAAAGGRLRKYNPAALIWPEED
jgi:nitrate reductase gamma subunit